MKNLLVFFVLLISGTTSHAVEAPRGWWDPNSATIHKIWGSAAELCAAINPAYVDGGVYSTYTSDSGYTSIGTTRAWTNTGDVRHGCKGTNGSVYGFARHGRFCETGQTKTINPPECLTCPTGYVELNGACVIPSECDETAGQVVSSGLYDLGTDDNSTVPTSACDGACVLSFTGTISAVARQLVGGVYHYYGQGSYTRIAETCTVSDVPSSSANLPPATCDLATQDQGTVNGKFVCLNRTTTKTTTVAPLVTNPDGSTSETTTTSDSATGKITLTTKTTGVDGTVSISEIVEPAPGTSTDFCVANPSDPTCIKDDIPWGEIPEAGIIPTHEVPISTAYTVIGGEGQCPADTSISFLGQSLTWSYAPICTFAGMIRPLVIGLAWLSFGFIIVGGLGRAK